MKELSIEEKAKAYDEAIERAREWSETKNGYYMPKELCEEIFPELKESEDERTWIINYLSNRELNSSVIAEKENLKKAIAWLERQGEQKPVEPQQDMLSREQYAKAVDECIYGEKSEWSEEELDSITAAINNLEYLKKNYVYHPMGLEPAITFLKSLKDRVLPQPKQEWSEEDENILEDIEEAIINYWLGDTQDILLDWLKSLRPQNTWKPSDKQMDMLAKVCSTLHLTSGENKIMESIYDDLMKLKG